MYEIDVKWPVAVVTHNSASAKLTKIEISAMQFLILRENLENVSIESNLVQRYAVNGIQFIDEANESVIKFRRVEDFAFETDCIMGHYFTLNKNEEQNEKLDGLMVVSQLTNSMSENL